MYRKKNLLLTNDDGYTSKGIQTLYQSLKDEYRVVIVAPDSEKSGVSHSFTINQPLFYSRVFNSYADEMYCLSGSPADCVKFAIRNILNDLPDLIISGLNIGENSGVSSHYSGTVAAAREGAFWKIRSLAFSVCMEAEEYSTLYAEMTPGIIHDIVDNNHDAERTIFYNVNFPACHPDESKGIKITRQSLAFFDDKYRETGESTNDKNRSPGYVIYGKKIDLELSDDYDSRALQNNWITITPLSFDSTAYSEIMKIKGIEKNYPHKV